MLCNEVPKNVQKPTFSPEEEKRLVAFFNTLFQIESSLCQENNNTKKDDVSKKESYEV